MQKITKKNWRLNSSLTLFAIIGLVIAVGIVSVRHPHIFDFSLQKAFTLDERTKTVLQQFHKPLKLKGFFTQDNPNLQEFQKRLELYKRENSNLSVKIIDPNRNPAEAEKYRISFNGESILQYEGRTERFRGITEEKITTALNKLAKSKTKTLYLLTGHRERLEADRKEWGVSSFIKFLKREGYSVKELKLINEKEIPKEASALLVLGATESLYPQEIKLIEEYLAKGGSLFLTTEPEHNDKGLEKLLKKGGIELENNVIVDQQSSMIGGDIFSPIVNIFARHPITDRFDTSLQFAFARSVKKTMVEPKGSNITELCITNDSSWGETDFKRLKEQSQVRFDNSDMKAPLSLAIAASYQPENNPFNENNTTQKNRKKAYIVVLGDTDICSNALIGAGGNLNFLLNAVNWLAGDEESIRIETPHEGEAQIISIAQSEAMPFLFFSVFFLPVLITVFGIRICQKRKYQH